ncbi:hypothetical protein EDC04DRAFT_2605731 [Pisolithus marmoratus]|nr:hypothetical protein EDC04DRAFT_2605731 [Pisolithus marmoratus]
MSQNITNTGLPTPAATQDWTTVPDKAIQSASKDEQEIADVKYAECQCQKQSKVPVVDRPRVSAPVGDRLGMSVLVPAETGNPGPAEGLKAKGKAKACDLVPVGLCAQCVRARTECMFKLVKASKQGKKSCDQCSGLKEQCMLPGGSNSMPKKNPEVEVQARPSRSESIAGEMLVAQGLHAITAAIDQHTNEMAKHWQIAKESQLHTETVAEVGESSDKEGTGEETSNGETDEDAEGEEAPESDLEVGYHKVKTESWIHEVEMSGVPVLNKTYWNIEENKSAIPLLSTEPTRYSRGWHRGLEVLEEGDGEDTNRKFQVPQGY